MKIVVTRSNDAGESLFEERDVTFSDKSFAPPAGPLAVSDPEPSTALMFVSLPAGWDDVTHPSPRCQTLVAISGAVRVTTRDGTEREMGPGAVWRMEDVHGKSHHTRVISEVPFLAAIVQHE